MHDRFCTLRPLFQHSEATMTSAKRFGAAVLLAWALPVRLWAQPGPVGSEFRVNTATTNSQYRPAVAADGAGNFVVAWMSAYQEGTSYNDGIYAQRYDSAGAPQGAEFHVNTYTTGGQRFPSVAAASGGNFVVVWQGQFQDGSGVGIFGQRYSSAGAAQGSEFRVNTFTTSDQGYPAAPADSAGNFVA